jgi:hypothetical protein
MPKSCHNLSMAQIKAGDGYKNIPNRMYNKSKLSRTELCNLLDKLENSPKKQVPVTNKISKSPKKTKVTKAKRTEIFIQPQMGVHRYLIEAGQKNLHLVRTLKEAGKSVENWRSFYGPRNRKQNMNYGVASIPDSRLAETEDVKSGTWTVSKIKKNTFALNFKTGKPERVYG